MTRTMIHVKIGCHSSKVRPNPPEGLRKPVCNDGRPTKAHSAVKDPPTREAADVGSGGKDNG
jgi:hypothetical protein